MTNQSVGPVAIRLLGLYAIVKAIDMFSLLTRLGLVAGPLYSGHSRLSVIFLVLPFALMLALAYTFTAYPGMVADRLLPALQEPGILDLPGPLINLAFVVAGVVILSDALSHLTHLVFAEMATRTSGPESVAATLAQLVVGLLAILRPAFRPLISGGLSQQSGDQESSAEQYGGPTASRFVEQIGALTFAVVGLVLLASALPFLLPAVIVYFVAGANYLNWQILAPVCEAAPKAILGLVLFLQPAGMIKLLEKRLFSVKGSEPL